MSAVIVTYIKSWLFVYVDVTFRLEQLVPFEKFDPWFVMCAPCT